MDENKTAVLAWLSGLGILFGILFGFLFTTKALLIVSIFVILLFIVTHFTLNFEINYLFGFIIKCNLAIMFSLMWLVWLLVQWWHGLLPLKDILFR